MAVLPNLPNGDFRGKYLKDQGIIHRIRENIIITEFQRFFENLLSQLNLFIENAHMSKTDK
jgi:hypothetical protein